MDLMCAIFMRMYEFKVCCVLCGGIMLCTEMGVCVCVGGLIELVQCI